jgi:hypothetical protein
MDLADGEFVMRVLQAHTIALCALLATHPDRQALLEGLETMTPGVMADPETMAVLRRALE